MPDSAVLVVGFPRLAERYDTLGIDAVIAQIARVGPRIVLFDDATTALIAALDLRRRIADLHAAVGLALGEIRVVDGGIHGAPVVRATTLAERVARHGEVLATGPFFAALGELPVGVGSWPGTPEQEKEAGFPLHVLRDWRD